MTEPASRKLYVLRAHHQVVYNDPEEGQVVVCEHYRDIRFSDTHIFLSHQAAVLNNGVIGEWTEDKIKDLRELDAKYTLSDDDLYLVEDVTILFSRH